MEIPSLLPRVRFLGVGRQEGVSSDPEKLKRNDIESGEQMEDFLSGGSTYGRAMYFGVTAVSRKGAEVKAEREAQRILRSVRDSDGDRAFNSDMWSAGRAQSYVDEFRLLDPKDAFLEDRPSLSPDEYIVMVSVGFNPW